MFNFYYVLVISSYIVGPEFNLPCRRVRSVIQAPQCFLKEMIFERSRQFCVAASLLKCVGIPYHSVRMHKR